MKIEKMNFYGIISGNKEVRQIIMTNVEIDIMSKVGDWWFFTVEQKVKKGFSVKIAEKSYAIHENTEFRVNANDKVITTNPEGFWDFIKKQDKVVDYFIETIDESGILKVDGAAEMLDFGDEEE